MDGSFQTFVGGGWALARLDFLRVVDIVEQTVVGIVEQFALLLLLDTFNEQAQLLANLIERTAEQIGDPCVNVEHRIDAAEPVRTRLLLILDKCGDQSRLILVAAG
jgi:phosphate uptake regulator